VLIRIFSKLYPHLMDVAMTQAGCRMVRSADDFVILCRTQEGAEIALALAQAVTSAKGLTD
jgi:RNA-directed DNA polymerase